MSRNGTVLFSNSPFISITIQDNLFQRYDQIPEDIDFFPRDMLINPDLRLVDDIQSLTFEDVATSIDNGNLFTVVYGE